MEPFTYADDVVSDGTTFGGRQLGDVSSYALHVSFSRSEQDLDLEGQLQTGTHNPKRSSNTADPALRGDALVQAGQNPLT